MELKPGYKQTDVGVIPEDWEVKRLGELYNFKNGVNADKEAYGKGIKFINVLEPITYSHIHGQEITGQVDLPEAAVATYSVRNGDIVFNRTSETKEDVALAAAYLGTELVVFGGFVIRGRPRGEDLEPVYAGYALRCPYIRSQLIGMGQGAVRANVGQQNLGTVLFPLPPLPEQKAIAKALSDMDSLLSGLDNLIAKKRDIKQATMQQLLTGKTRLPGFSGEWQEKRLGELSSMGSGGTPLSSVPAYYGGDIPWVSIADMTRSGKLVIGTERYLTQLGFTNSACTIFPKGTVLYAMYASLGECCIAAESVCTSQAILGIRPSSNLDGEFLYYTLVSLKNVVRTMGQQGTQSNLNKGMVQEFRLQLPPLPEQQAIATVLSDIDAELEALEQRRDKTRELKQAMMQELLTGRTRLV
jgi:type I restriction enzyme S subunit